MFYEVIIVNVLSGVLIFFIIAAAIPQQRCVANNDCVGFCDSLGYNSSDCSTRIFRINRVCECSVCDFVKCATFCTRKNLKFVGCTCFSLPSPFLAIVENSIHRTITNDCSEDKFFCQCSK